MTPRWRATRYAMGTGSLDAIVQFNGLRWEWRCWDASAHSTAEGRCDTLRAAKAAALKAARGSK
jgi:hypothetical protein